MAKHLSGSLIIQAPATGKSLHIQAEMVALATYAELTTVVIDLLIYSSNMPQTISSGHVRLLTDRGFKHFRLGDFSFSQTF